MEACENEISVANHAGGRVPQVISSCRRAHQSERQMDWLREFNIQRAAGLFHLRFVIVNDDNHDASE